MYQNVKRKQPTSVCVRFRKTVYIGITRTYLINIMTLLCIKKQVFTTQFCF